MASIQKAKTHCVRRWAAGSTSRGRTGNMSFIGPAGYSYATVVAVLYPDKKTCVIAGEGIHNSVSTCAHKRSFAFHARKRGYHIIEADVPSWASVAASSIERIDGLEVCLTHMDDLLEARAAAVTGVGRKLSKATRAVRYREFLRYLTKYHALASFLRHVLPVPEDFDLDSEAEGRNLEEHERKCKHGTRYVAPACPGTDNVL